MPIKAYSKKDNIYTREFVEVKIFFIGNSYVFAQRWVSDH